MTPRRAVVVPVLAASLALAGCASSTNGALVSGSNPPTSGSPSGSGSSTPSAGATPTTAGALAQRITQATRTIKTAHFSLTGGFAGQTFTGSGDQVLADGKPTAFRVSDTIPRVGQLALIKANGKTYIKLPAALGGSTGGKPWHVASTTSSNPLIRTFATTLDSLSAADSFGQIAAFAQSLSSLKALGDSTVDGNHATRYALTVSVAKLPASFPGRSALTQAGLTSLPLQLWIDDSGRPVKLTENLTVRGATVSTTVTLGRFDRPVTISAPPASQIAAD